MYERNTESMSVVLEEEHLPGQVSVVEIMERKWLIGNGDALLAT